MNEIKSLYVRLSDRGKVCSRIIHRLLQEQHVNINATKRTCSSPLPRPMCIFGSGNQKDNTNQTTNRTCSRSFSSANQTSPSWIVRGGAGRRGAGGAGAGGGAGGGGM